MNWHCLAPKKEVESISRHFANFIKSILYEEARFCLYKTHFTLFGQHWPVYKTWFVNSKSVWEQFERDPEKLFRKRKQCPNGDYIYEDTVVPAVQVITRECRRQLVRDFVWLIRDTEHYGLWLQLLMALQDVLRYHAARGDVWLAALHQACQGQCNLDEVPCWDVCHTDVHSSMG